MPQVMPDTRMRDLTQAATRVFINAYGYQRAKMEDVARALNISKAAIYGCVESKEALFDLALRYADRLDTLPEFEALPVKTPEPGHSLQIIADRVGSNSVLHELRKRLGHEPTVAAWEELDSVAGLLYDLIESNRNALKLLERCALDHPRLGESWREIARGDLLDSLESFVSTRVAHGVYAQDLDAAIGARFLLENCVFWAMHRYWDQMPITYDNERARQNAVSLIVRAFLDENPARLLRGQGGD